MAEMEKGEFGITNESWSSFFTHSRPEKYSFSILLHNNFLGDKDELGKKLLRDFLKAAVKDEDESEAILILIHQGVNLACEGSPFLPELLSLTQKGWKIFVCGLSVKELALKEKVIVGEEVGVAEIFQLLKESYKVISL